MWSILETGKLQINVNEPRIDNSLLTFYNFLHHFVVFKIFFDGDFEMKILQSVVEIFAIDICASPKRKDLKRKCEKVKQKEES